MNDVFNGLVGLGLFIFFGCCVIADAIRGLK